MQHRTIALFAFLLSLIAYSWTGFLLVTSGGAVSGTIPIMLVFSIIGALFTAGIVYASEKNL